MADKTGIEWTDATWNPIVGCSVVSPGCTNCYAMRTAGARTAHTAKYAGLTQSSKAGPVWRGSVRFWEKALLDPLRWRAPRRIFVNSMGDLFHEAVPDEWIDRVFAVMALAPQHTFQVLTKRAARMRDYLSMARAHPVGLEALNITLHEYAARPGANIGAGVMLQGDIAHLKMWPLPNVWLGVSAEDQARADERIPYLLATPAAVRFVSAEPLLGPIHLDDAWPESGSEVGLDWVIVGGESGPRARPMHPDWARGIRDQCVAAGVPFFFKQCGEYCPHDERIHAQTPFYLDPEGRQNARHPQRVALAHPGKAAAGRVLDGRTWDEFPTPAGGADPAEGVSPGSPLSRGRAEGSGGMGEEGAAA